MVFPEVMYGCESWTIKKAECWGIDAFELWCWRRLLRVLWIARRSNPSILKEISPYAEAETPILWPPDVKTNSLEKTLILGKIEGQRRRRWKRMRWLVVSLTQWTWVWASSGSWWWTGKPGVLKSMGWQWIGHDWTTELTDWRHMHLLAQYKLPNCSPKWILSKHHTLLAELFSCFPSSLMFNILRILNFPI